MIEPSEIVGGDTPVYERVIGAGFLIVVEARAGAGSAQIGRCNTSFNEFDPGERPDIQIISDRDLGAGDPAVCDGTLARQTLGGACGPHTPSVMADGGVPAMSSFDPSSQAVANALNDFGCRMAFFTAEAPCTETDFGNPRYASTESQGQFCSESTISFEMRFPSGDTTLTARWRDSFGVLGPEAKMVVRVP